MKQLIEPFFSARNQSNTNRNNNNDDETDMPYAQFSSDNNIRSANNSQMKALINYEYNTITNPIGNKEKNPIIQKMKLQAYR